MTRSIIRLPADADADQVEVYLNGVPQKPGIDYRVDGRALIFESALRKDRLTGWRWFLGAWGIGTYRRDDTVDIRYEADGVMKVEHAAAIELVDEPASDAP